jgi:hypothetical protein
MALLDMVADTPAGQPAPNLLLGAVHALLLDGAEHPLREYYPTCVDDPRDPDEGAPVEQFESFCLAHEGTIPDIASTRRVQTNEVGRAAVLLPAFASVARRADEPLALVEVGASAGLNLLWDRYRYEYATDAGPLVRGDPDSPVEIRSELRGERRPPLPGSSPDVAERVGIDLNPLSVTDEADASWLRALVIPDQLRRHERLAAAIDLAREDPPALVAGDALDVLPDVLADLPDEATPCVFSTLTLYQFEDDEVASLRATLRDASRERPVHWLSGDPDSPTGTPTYRHVAFEDGDPLERELATHAAYGEWIEWLAGE